MPLRLKQLIKSLKTVTEIESFHEEEEKIICVQQTAKQRDIKQLVDLIFSWNIVMPAEQKFCENEWDKLDGTNEDKLLSEITLE